MIAIHIERLDAGAAQAAIPDLIEILRDVVNAGASVGFLPPLDADEARAYWEDVVADLPGGYRIMLVARQGTRVVGTVQLDLAKRPNGRHRAEVQKLLVHRSVQHRGIARALMAEAERQAQAAGRSLLVLDTRQGDLAEALYERIGFVRAGVIPEFALNAEGGRDATVLFYKILPPGGV